MSRHPGFPFEPKSTAFVRPGDFWAIPTRRGGWYCCGRVLATSDLTATRSIVAALLSWCEPQPPTTDTIAGARVIEYGIAHVKTVRESGGMLLGHRPLDADGLDQLLNDRDMRNVNVWGYLSIEYLAHEHFGRHFPEDPPIAIERPTSLRQLSNVHDWDL